MAFTLPSSTSPKGKSLLPRLRDDHLRFVARELDLEVPELTDENKIKLFEIILRRISSLILQPLLQEGGGTYDLVSKNKLMEYLYKMVASGKIPLIDIMLYVEPLRWYFSIRHKPSTLRNYNLPYDIQQLDPDALLTAYSNYQGEGVSSEDIQLLNLWKEFVKLMYSEYASTIVYHDSKMLIFKPTGQNMLKTILNSIGNHIYVCVGLSQSHFNYYNPLFVGVFHPSAIKIPQDYSPVRSYEGLVYAIATFGTGKEFHLMDNEMVPINEGPFLTYATKMLDIIYEKYPRMVKEVVNYIDDSIIDFTYDDFKNYMREQIKYNDYYKLNLPIDLLVGYMALRKDQFVPIVRRVAMIDYAVSFMEEAKGEEVDVNDYKKLWTEFLRVKERVLEEDERRYLGIISEIEKKPVHFTRLFPKVCPVSAVEDVTSYIIDFFNDEFVGEDEYENLFSKISSAFKDHVVGLFATHLEIILKEGYGSDHEEPHITYYREIIGMNVDYEDIRYVAEGMSYELKELMENIIIYYIEKVKDRIKKRGLRDVFVFDGKDEKFAQMVDRWVVNLKDVYEKAFNNVFLQMDLL